MSELVSLVEKLHKLWENEIRIGQDGTITTSIPGAADITLHNPEIPLLTRLKVLEEELGLKDRDFTPDTGTFEQRLNRLKNH